MKSLFIPIAVVAFALIGTTTEADAQYRRGHASGHVYISGYRSCGTPIYTERYLVGYTRCGDPIWGYRRVSYERHYAPRPVRRHYYHPPAYCPPPVPPCGDYRRGGVVFHGSYRF